MGSWKKHVPRVSLYVPGHPLGLGHKLVWRESAQAGLRHLGGW